MKLRDKIIVVTGASKGIGAEAARQLAAEGAHVVLAARSRALLEENARTIREAGGRALVVDLDVESEESAESAVRTVLAELGHIDILLNNAGSGGALGFFSHARASDLASMCSVHLFGTERMTRMVLPGMLARGSGRIVNVVSTVGYVPMPGAAAYSAAKAAVIAHTAALRGELEKTPIELVLFSPPHTQTESGKGWKLELPKQFFPPDAARALVHALLDDRTDVLAGGNNALLYLQRLSPRLAQRIMNNIGVAATERSLLASSEPPRLA